MANTLISNLYERVMQNAAAPALCDDRYTVSFGELLARAQQIHKLLQSVGVAPGDRVAVCSDNSVEYLIAIYGILHAGCAFVPLPFRDPEARTQRLYAKAAPAAIFIDGTKRIGEAGRRFDLNEAVGLERPIAADDRALPSHLASRKDNVAYVIFTSGSTGEPKGVCIANRSFYYAVHEAGHRMAMDPTTRSLAILPIHFDGSFSSIFPALMFGGSVFINRSPLCLPVTFCSIFARHAITHTTVTPTYLRALVESEDWSPSSCQTWRTLAVGGEAPPKSALRRLREQLPQLRFFNRYGPTEATMAVSTHEISAEMLSSDEKIPIGPPHTGVELLAVGSDGTPISPGEIGELYIGGRQLMVGYLDDQAATEAVIGGMAPNGTRFLKTRDLVTINAAGHYVFVERSDNVIKRNGIRISLAEIETALNGLDGVAAAACVELHADGSTQIVAFVQRLHSDVDSRDVRRELLGQLPAYMIPNAIRFVNEMPKTLNGKTDHKALRSLACAEASQGEER